MNRYGTFRDNSVQRQIEIWKEEIASQITASKLSKMIREAARNPEQIKIWNEEIASKLTTDRLAKMIRELRKN